MKVVVNKVAWAKREETGKYRWDQRELKSQDIQHNWKNERAYDPSMMGYSKRRAENPGEKFEKHTWMVARKGWEGKLYWQTIQQY